MKHASVPARVPRFHHDSITPMMGWRACQQLHDLFEHEHPEYFSQTALVWVDLAGDWSFVMAGKADSRFVIAAYSQAERELQHKNGRQALPITTANGRNHGFIGISSTLPPETMQDLLIHALHLTLDPDIPSEELTLLLHEFRSDSRHARWLINSDRGNLPARTALERSIRNHPANYRLPIITSNDVPKSTRVPPKPKLRVVPDLPPKEDASDGEGPESSMAETPQTEH